MKAHSLSSLLYAAIIKGDSLASVGELFSRGQGPMEFSRPVIALGCVVKGKTHSFDCVVNSVTAGFAQLNVTSAVPVIFGVLATETMEDARERAGGALGNKGEECAVAAIKMAKF